MRRLLVYGLMLVISCIALGSALAQTIDISQISGPTEIPKFSITSSQPMTWIGVAMPYTTNNWIDSNADRGNGYSTTWTDPRGYTFHGEKPYPFHITTTSGGAVINATATQDLLSVAPLSGPTAFRITVPYIGNPQQAYSNGAWYGSYISRVDVYRRVFTGASADLGTWYYYGAPNSASYTSDYVETANLAEGDTLIYSVQIRYTNFSVTNTWIEGYWEEETEWNWDCDCEEGTGQYYWVPGYWQSYVNSTWYYMLSNANPLWMNYTAKAAQTITFGNPGPRHFEQGPITLGATASSGLPVSYALSGTGVGSITDGVLTVTQAGDLTVTASQGGNHEYSAAIPVSQTFTVSKANQAINFSPIEDRVYGTAPFSLSATSSSGLPASYAVVSGPATVSGNTVTLTAAGTVTISASQTGNVNYNAAPTVSRTFSVSVGSTPSVSTFATAGNHSYPTPPGTAYVLVKAWGAGGGKGAGWGGAGAFISGGVLAAPGHPISVVVGQGGAGAYNTHYSTTPSEGGQASVVTLPNGVQFFAAGGGGGGGAPVSNSSGGPGGAFNGGPGEGGYGNSGGGGGTTILSGSTFVATGGAGGPGAAWQAQYDEEDNYIGSINVGAGGDGGTLTVSGGAGKHERYSGGGGGGGFGAGGGGGGASSATTGGGGGGGGSSAILGAVLNPTLLAGTAHTAPNTLDPHYPGGGVAAGASGNSSGWSNYNGSEHWYNGQPGGRGHVVIIAYPTAPPAITSSLGASATTGVSYTYSIVATNSPMSYTLDGTLPIGFLFNASSGTISGTTSQVGTFNLTIGATNSTGTGTATLVLTVNPPPPAITSNLHETGMVGTPFSYTIAGTNSPTSYSVIGTLPTGLTINTATGVISGTPTQAGTFNISIRATNGGGTGSDTLALTIHPQRPVITSSLNASGAVGTAFSYSITATNSPTSYNVFGTLPAGLSVNGTTGAITGTPTQAGTFNVLLGATNSSGTGSASYTLTVSGPPVITSPSHAGAVIGAPFTYVIAATNTPSGFSLTGTLPSGLSFNVSTGVISGTPSQTGSLNVTIGATNASGTGTTGLTITALADSDGDGVPDAVEQLLGTNANSAATPDTTNQTNLRIQHPVQ